MTYSAFGLGLWVSQELPRLAGAPVSATTDLRIWVASRPPWVATLPPSVAYYESTYRDERGVPFLVVGRFNNGWLHLAYLDGTQFFVDRDGNEIWVTWPDDMSIDDMSSYLLGPVMGLVLRLRGGVCLHGSAIAAGAVALALIGPPGAGKSTTAAAFGTLGNSILTDDLIPLTESGGSFIASPGYPRVRLWPAAARALSAIDHRVPELPAGSTEKRYHLNLIAQGYAFQTTPLPLGGIYVLAPRSDDATATTIEPLRGEAAVMALVTNSFALNVLDRQLSALDFEVLSRVAVTVPMRSVLRPSNLDGLRDVCEAILADVSAITAQNSQAGLA